MVEERKRLTVLLGVFDQFKPKFTKRYAELSKVAVDAIKAYAADIRSGKFPDAEHSYSMKPEEAETLHRLVKKRSKTSIASKSMAVEV